MLGLGVPELGCMHLTLACQLSLSFRAIATSSNLLPSKMAEHSSCSASDSSASSQVSISLEELKALMVETARTAVRAKLATLNRSGAASGIIPRVC